MRMCLTLQRLETLEEEFCLIAHRGKHHSAARLIAPGPSGSPRAVVSRGFADVLSDNDF